MNEPKIGEPGFGTESQPSQPPVKPLRNQPDWNEFMDPKRYREKLSGKRKPSEFAPEPTPKPPLRKGP